MITFQDQASFPNSDALFWPNHSPKHPNQTVTWLSHRTHLVNIVTLISTAMWCRRQYLRHWESADDNEQSNGFGAGRPFEPDDERDKLLDKVLRPLRNTGTLHGVLPSPLSGVSRPPFVQVWIQCSRRKRFCVVSLALSLEV